MIFSVITLVVCDPNSKPSFGGEIRLQKNCRAIAQRNIDAYRTKQFTSNEIMVSLERNCGTYGSLELLAKRYSM